MNLHFGETTAQRENLYLDFAKMKIEYQSLELMNPQTKFLRQFEKGMEEDKVDSMTEMLLAKTRKATNPGFSYNW